MVEGTIVALAMVCAAVYGPFIMALLERGLDPLAEKLADYVESRINKKEDI